MAKKNPIYEEYQRARAGISPRAGIAGGAGDDDGDAEYPWRCAIGEIRARMRREERRTMWEASSTQMEGIRERKDVTARMIDGCVSRRCRRMVTLWILKRIPGKPTLCLNCQGAARTSRRHAIECCRVDPTARLAGGQILAALEEISVVVSRCMGWSVSKLTRDIIREHTAWEAREVALAESRANLERTSGGNAHWRYYARRD